MENSSSEKEKQWENYVSDLRDPFAPLAMPTLTIAVIIICGIIIATRKPNYIFLFLWFIVTFSSSVKLYLQNKKLRKEAKIKAKQYVH